MCLQGIIVSCTRHLYLGICFDECNYSDDSLQYITWRESAWFSRDVRKKLKLKILSFYLHQVKVMFNHTPLACLQLGRSLCLKIEHVTHVTRENNDSPYVF